MPIWPFKRRRRGDSHNNAYDGTAAAEPRRPRAERAKPDQQPTPTASPALNPSTATPPVPRRSSRSGSARGRRRASQQRDHTGDARSPVGEIRLDSANKENVPPPDYGGSKEDITALPMAQRLEQSPHLRPADLARPQIPYNFRPHSMSQTSVQGQDTLSKLSKSQTLRSKRSTIDYGTPSRKFSARSKRRDDPVREEEIRAMTAPIPIPKRHGDGLLRRDSKKVRGLTGDSQVSLPPEGSIHSSMSGVVEQRGWEIGSLAVFSPRPAVRLSGLPQYVSNSLPPSSSGILYRIDSIRAKDKAPTTQDSKSLRKRRTVGTEADDLGASDIRTIMERDAKRREKRQQERQEQLDRKLRAKAGRERADSEKKRRSSDERRRVEQARARAGEQLQARGVLTPPIDVHPALRESAAPSPKPVGLGIGESGALAKAATPDQQRETEDEDTAENPFVDTLEQHEPSPAGDKTAEPTTTIPEEEPFLGTAQAVRMSQANTPPLSPVYGRITSSTSQLAEVIRQESMSQQSMADLPLAPRIPFERRSSDPPKEKRAGTWATLFRRGGTFRRSVQEPKEPPAEGSFSNTSRESMRNQPLPAHLVGTDIHRPAAKRLPSGTPARTQSRFREDLPEIPVSPPDSRTQSPDVTTAAAAAAAAHRAGRTTIIPQPVDIPGRSRDSEGDAVMGARNDTPISPIRGHSAMAGSLASIDSEGSWLAGGATKRQSITSNLNQTLNRRAESLGSYEELGIDKDVEYLTRNASPRGRSNVNSPTLMGASPDEESEEESTSMPQPGEPLTVHGSVRRKPTLVQRDPRLKSREGLVQEYAAQEGVETPYEASIHSGDESDEYEPEFPHPQIARATSVKTGNRHSRQISAGSARLLDVPGRRQSIEASRENTPSPHPSLSRSLTYE